MTLSHPYHPNQFKPKDPMLVHRAAVVYQKLKSALDEHTAVPATDRTPTRDSRGGDSDATQVA